jgi:hypothetical protein
MVFSTRYITQPGNSNVIKRTVATLIIGQIEQAMFCTIQIQHVAEKMFTLKTKLLPDCTITHLTNQTQQLLLTYMVPVITVALMETVTFGDFIMTGSVAP